MILIDEVADLLQRTPSRGHVIIDEAQDLSPMMLRAVGRRASTGSVTVLGDLAQATTPWATRSWRESLTHLGHPDAAIEELVAGFRVPGAVIDFAARLLPHIAPTLKPPHSVRRHRGELDVRPTARIGEELVEAITQADAQRRHGGSDRRRCRRPRRSEAAGAASRWITTCSARIRRSSMPAPTLRARSPDVTPSYSSRSWFRHRSPRAWSSITSCSLEPAEIVAGEPDQVTGLRRLYVCLTRAVTSLVVVHAAELPAALAA